MSFTIFPLKQKKVTFLPAKPHTKGIINTINFMPWSDTCFLTGGSDHAVILWQEKDDAWNHKKVHKDSHSSAVNGVAGLQQRKTILSVSVSKILMLLLIIGFHSAHEPLIALKSLYVCVKKKKKSFNVCHLSSMCSRLPWCLWDIWSLFVSDRTPGRQLRLFDIRLRQTEVHAIGWKQTSSESQSALINQSWSPDGWYLSSGSADPVIHIFDIRYQGQTPCQSVQAHQKRVFKAVWHQTFPVLTSISSRSEERRVGKECLL